MLDIHILWFFVLVANFLGLIYILNIILFKPLLKIFKERDDIVMSSLDAVKEMDSRKEEGITRVNIEFADARSKAKEVFEAMRSEGLIKQKDVMSEAEASAGAMLQKAREDLRVEVARAKQTLKADIEKFSNEIVRKLIKV